MSSFGWLDFSEADRQKTLDVIDLFREKGTVDELGIGTIRDAIADLLFPGTSTIMTRARYYLFIPWIYLRHEAKKTSSSEIARLARKDEVALIEGLRRTGESLGVIGIESGPELKRLASTIYWQSLGVLGIRKYDGSRDNYHRAYDSFNKKRDIIRGDDGHTIVGGNLRRWDPSLPQAPADFLRESTLDLSKVEANYMRERLMQAAPHSLFSYLVNHPLDDNNPAFPWEHVDAARVPAANREELMHARNFAEVMHGSALLYNLMAAEKRKNREWTAKYEVEFADWAALMRSRRTEINAWSIPGFWSLVQGTGARIAPATRAFVTMWFERVIGKSAAAIEGSKEARALIIARERQLKGNLARLTNPRALDHWGGASSSERLTYRWNRPVKAILADIRRPLEK